MHHASHATAKHGPSLLEVVAEHESGLMAKVADAELQAKSQLDESHTEAAGFLTEDYAQLEREVSDMRKRATEQRDSAGGENGRSAPSGCLAGGDGPGLHGGAAATPCGNGDSSYHYRPGHDCATLCNCKGSQTTPNQTSKEDCCATAGYNNHGDIGIVQAKKDGN